MCITKKKWPVLPGLLDVLTEISAQGRTLSFQVSPQYAPNLQNLFHLSHFLLLTHLFTLFAGFFSFGTLWASDSVDTEHQRAAAERRLLWRTSRWNGSAVHGRRVWHLLPSLSEGVPAEGVRSRALQLRHHLDTRARWEYIFFTQEWQSQDRVAIQLCVAGESKRCWD